MDATLERQDSGPARVRPRLSRTFSRSRWAEYERFLRSAQENGYRILSLEDWVSAGRPVEGEPTLILRHDVDQHPRSALRMAAIEKELGVRSSWYFRWRTAHPAVVEKVKRDGFQVGLHYETMSRIALQRDLHEEPSEELIESCREVLRSELAAFEGLFGPCHVAVPHGDSRIPEVHNALLLKGQDCSEYGIDYDGNEVMRGHDLGLWLTDRIASEGGWMEGIDPLEKLAERASPILTVTHPNNWASGPSLWTDRMLGTILPNQPLSDGRRASRPIRTGTDEPPA
ncbi:MAG TPA: hypothetical protein VLB79_07155 [Solirubrobacterales bacterium]|nr:hypothetical protein [Solirubrobacterales bacterium]